MIYDPYLVDSFTQGPPRPSREGVPGRVDDDVLVGTGAILQRVPALILLHPIHWKSNQQPRQPAHRDDGKHVIR